MFGQSGNTSFSGFNTAAQSSPFGQSAFGKPITTTSFGSGATPVFGSGNTLFSSKPAGSTTGGLFGNTATPPAFRQPTNTQPSFGGFGTTNTNTNLFGTQQNAGTNLFGTSTATSAFGQPNKPGGFTFGPSTSTNLFGQPQQTTQQTTPFGQTNTTGNTNLFGTTSGFGSAITTTGMTGTVVKFTPVITTDSMSKNGISHNISARHHCIASMKEYESKSYEELRYEDYAVGRKGPGTGPGTGLFGATAQASPFSNTGTGTSTAATGFGAMSGGFGATSQSNTSSLFGKPIAGTGFGAPATTTTNSFAFNSSGTNNLFGSNNQNKPFGTAAPTPLFPTSNTNQTAGTGFCTTQNTTFGSTFGTAQPNQNIGLFNQNKSTFNTPATSTGTGFPAFGQTPASNTNATLFGAKTTGAPGFGTTSTFGQTAQSTFGTNTGFGTTQNTSNSLFNSSFKPVGQPSGFLFGCTPPSSTGLGTNTGLSLGSGTLFGQQKTGGLFGNTGNTTTFNTPGTFGTGSTFGTNTSTMSGLGMGLMNNNNTINQMKNSGTVPVHQQILALVSAPFGDSPLLKNLLPASGKTEELLKPANAASKMMNSPQYKVNTNSSKSPRVKAKVVSATQLSKKSLFEGLEEEDPVLSEAFQPRPNAKRLVLRPKSISNSTGITANENSQSTIDKENTKEDGVEPTLCNGVESPNKENHNQKVISWLKSNLPNKTKIQDEHFEGQRSPFSETNAQDETLNNTVAELWPNNNSANHQNHSNANNSMETPLNSSVFDKTTSDPVVQNSDSSQEVDENSFSVLNPQWSANLAKVTLRRVGYYTIPSLDKLDEYVRGETCIVPNFTVGREGYGNVYFPESFDIYGLNLDEIVHFRDKEVIIYPDDDKKPPVGEGLNRKAQVTLDKVWPHDKSLHEPITDPRRLAAMNYEAKLRRVSAKHDTRFLEYRPETGSWVFNVDHFSKYGLSDSDEENNGAPINSDPKKLKVNATLAQKATGKSQELKNTNKDASNGITNSTQLGNGKLPEIDTNYLDEASTIHSDSLLGRDYVVPTKPVAVSPTGTYARIMGTDSHKLQLMKASFFDTVDESIDHDFPCNGDYASVMSGTLMRSFLSEKGRAEHHDVAAIYAPVLRTNFLQTPYAMEEDEEALYKPSIKPKWKADVAPEERDIYPSKETIVAFPEPVVAPVTTVLKYHSEVVPFKDSIIKKLQFRCVADAGIQMGRMFRPSWGRGLTLLSLSTQEQAGTVPLKNALSKLSLYVSGRLLNDHTSANIVQRLQIFGGDATMDTHSQVFKESIEGHLKIQLDHCIMGHDGDCPALDVSTESASVALHAHCALAEDLASQHDSTRSAKYAMTVWKLFVALWGNLPDIDPSTGSEDHHNVMVRREAVGDWLKSVVENTVDEEIGEDDITHEKLLISLLTAFRLEEACQRARQAGDYTLALLMSQLCSGAAVKELMKQQLALWQETDVDQNISIERLKLYMLVAGEPLISSKHGTINVCESLDWKRAFAVHLWYLSSPTASIRDALELYEASFDAPPSEVYSQAPKPVYKEGDLDVEMSNGTTTYDLCFHLLKLYCVGNHSLGVLLNPLTHTADPLDYRLSWLVQQTLLALGYSHLPEHVVALTHTNFATQLEAHGLWHWAIFVMLHLRHAGRRRAAVIDLLERHIEVDEDPDYVEREQFLREELAIPSAWIHRAKAVKSLVYKRYGEAAWYLIQAEQWNTAHEVIIEHLAADAIINENYEYLKSLLNPLLPEECSGAISGWEHQGQLLWDYMEITTDVKSLLECTDACMIGYKLEALEPRLTSLCSKINQFPCPTAKHRLCQAEIAKRSLHLAKSLILLQSDEERYTTRVLQLISQLPLPEDYAQQELRPIVNKLTS